MSKKIDKSTYHTHLITNSTGGGGWGGGGVSCLRTLFSLGKKMCKQVTSVWSFDSNVKQRLNRYISKCVQQIFC